jgi:hypothetical protein
MAGLHYAQTGSAHVALEGAVSPVWDTECS